MSTAAVRRHWSTLAAMGCLITGLPAEIAHCHGGSLLEHGYVKAKGKKLDYMDWLVLPLSPRIHRLDPDSLDLNPRAFEERYGTQVYWLDEMVRRTGVNVWDLARSRHDWIKVAA